MHIKIHKDFFSKIYYNAKKKQKKKTTQIFSYRLKITRYSIGYECRVFMHHLKMACHLLSSYGFKDRKMS